MALITCGECQAQVSDKAAACPKCGAPVTTTAAAAPAGSPPATAATTVEPTTSPPAIAATAPAPAVSPVASTPTAKPGGPSALRIIAAVLAGLAIAGVVAYKFVLGNKAREVVAESLGNTAVGQHVLPWADKAEAAAKALTSGESGGNIASSIVKIAHPTGENPALKNVSVRRMGDQLSVRIDVGWHGGFLGSENSTTVVWEFDQQRHIRASILADTGAFGVAGDNARKLDEYFRDEAYRVLRSNTGE